MQLNKSHTKSYELPELSEAQWGYIAGVIDGEAHIRQFEVRKTSIGVNYGFEIAIAQNNIEFLEILRDWLGEGNIRFKKTPNARKPVYQLEIKKRFAVYKILNRILPLLIVKRRVSEDIVSYIARVYGETAMHG